MPILDRQPALRDLLHDAGLRATPARLAVLRVLHEARAPLTHSEVVARLDGGRWDPATVFRNLVTLVEAGFVRRTDVGDHVWRFETRGEPDEDEADHEHAHFLCTECGEVTCMPQLRLQLPRGSRVPRSVRTRDVRIQLQGLCDDCV
ncbi:MAG: transcriptional repressor [Myxococcales bacterium]|nr:transcriptional repressor [Myxococcales bacterium]MCB9718977.1 transcriptional repressor [Myxococcales bacterium]